MWWSREYPVTLMAAEAEISENTACAIYQWLREVCSTALLGMPMILGGPGVIVQIDESQFKHKPKVCIIIRCYHVLLLIVMHLCSITVDDLLLQICGCLVCV